MTSNMRMVGSAGGHTPMTHRSCNFSTRAISSVTDQFASILYYISNLGLPKNYVTYSKMNDTRHWGLNLNKSQRNIDSILKQKKETKKKKP